MKVTVLAENTACRADVTAQHGLSLFIETQGQKILFDMGQDDTFIRNGEALEINLAEADLAIVSHGHYDHGGGLEAFLKLNATAPVLIHEDAFGAYYNGTQKYIGLDRELRQHPRLVLTKGETQVSAGLRLSDCNEWNWCSNPWGLNRREGEVFLPDDFRHEQYLVITEGNRRLLISGCSHKGIVNIARHFRPDVLIGGFHLNKQEDASELNAIADELLSGNTVYYTGHCTGEKQFALLKERMGNRLRTLSTGFIFEV